MKIFEFVCGYRSTYLIVPASACRLKALQFTQVATWRYNLYAPVPREDDLSLLNEIATQRYGNHRPF